MFFSSDAARPSEGRKSKNQHGHCVDQGETEQPGGWSAVPFAPRGDCSINREHAEERARRFMKELADGAPDGAQRDFDRVPQNWVEAGRHARILIQFEGLGCGVDSECALADP